MVFETLKHWPVLGSIVAATLFGGALSVVMASWWPPRLLARVLPHLVSASTGTMLGVALLDVLPEAFESQVPPSQLFVCLLGGLLFYFLLEKAELYRHSHHHEGDHPHHHHHHGFDAEQAGRGGWSVLVGNTIHNFCDGVMIATAFLADPLVGWTTAFAVLLHEIPQEVGDFIVLLNAGFSRARALTFNLLASLASVVGGVIGYYLLGAVSQQLPYLLVIAASGLLYVAVADLIPQLQQRTALRESLAQITWIGVGLALMAAMSSQLHGH